MVYNKGENVMKNKIYIFIPLIFIFVACGFDTNKEYTCGIYTFKYIDKQSVSLCEVGYSQRNSDTLYIPKTIYGNNVVKIENIGSGSAKKIVLPSTVKSIGKRAFKWCKNIETISLPDGLTAIEDEVFYGCFSLKAITLPASVKNIGKSAFKWCENIETISLPDGLTTIEDEVFYGCSSLKEITLSASVKSIGNSAFSDCSELTNVIFADTNSWYVKQHYDSSTWASVNVTNPAANAEYLKYTYNDYRWEKRQ